MEDRNDVQLEDLLPSCIIQEIETFSEDEIKEESDSEKEDKLVSKSNTVFNDLSPHINKYDTYDPFAVAFKPEGSKTKSLPMYNRNSLVCSEDANETNTSSPKSRLFESNNCLELKKSDSISSL